jgi:hypothetical protein
LTRRDRARPGRPEARPPARRCGSARQPSASSTAPLRIPVMTSSHSTAPCAAPARAGWGVCGGHGFGRRPQQIPGLLKRQIGRLGLAHRHPVRGHWVVHLRAIETLTRSSSPRGLVLQPLGHADALLVTLGPARRPRPRCGRRAPARRLPQQHGRTGKPQVTPDSYFRVPQAAPARYHPAERPAPQAMPTIRWTEPVGPTTRHRHTPWWAPSASQAKRLSRRLSGHRGQGGCDACARARHHGPVLPSPAVNTGRTFAEDGASLTAHVRDALDSNHATPPGT